MAFPWDNLITAISTLVAGLGVVGLKQRGDRAERKAEAIRQDAQDRADRRGAAYANLVTTAMDMQLHYEQMTSVRQRWTAEHPESVARARLGEETGKQFGRAISMVQLVGSDAARAAAKAVHDATVGFAGTLEPREIDRLNVDAASRAMFAAIDGFLDAVRPETAS